MKDGVNYNLVPLTRKPTPKAFKVKGKTFITITSLELEMQTNV